MEIKLDKGIPYEGSPAQAFMKRFEDESVAHPLNQARILDNCQVECHPTNGNRGIHISDIRSFIKGAGTIALKHLCSIADLYGTPMSLVAKGYADTPTKVLVRWYVENGFVMSGFGSDNDGYRMLREPKRIMKLGGDNRVIKLTGFKYSGTDDDDGDEDLYEAKTMFAGNVKVWKNPSGRELIAIADNLGHDLRGLLNGNDVYVWDAMLATHDRVANYLSLSSPLAFHVSDQTVSYYGYAFDGMVKRLHLYVDQRHILDFHKCAAYMRMKQVRGLFG